MTATIELIPLSFSQELITLCIGLFTASCSIAGSFCILYLIYRQQQEAPLDPFRRLMVGMSMCDILHSFWLLWQGLLIPQETSPRYFAIGDNATCSMLGFFLQLGFSVAIYNGMISFHHLLIIRYGLSPNQIAAKYEPWMHGMALVFPLTAALMGLALGAFNETFWGPGCWVADYPQGCREDPDVPCQSTLVGYLFAGIPIVLIFIAITVNMVRICRHVRSTYAQSTRTSTYSTLQSTARIRMEQVAIQAYLFVLVFFITFFFGFLAQGMAATTTNNSSDDPNNTTTWNESSIFPYIVLNQIFYPLQGFFNFFIYCRPRYMTVRFQHPDQSRWWAFQQVLQPNASQQPSSRHTAAAAARRIGFVRTSSSGSRRVSPEQSTLSRPFSHSDEDKLPTEEQSLAGLDEREEEEEVAEEPMECATA